MNQASDPWVFVIVSYGLVYLSLLGLRLGTELQIRKTRKEMEALHEG